jgi:hypothetical protein
MKNYENELKELKSKYGTVYTLTVPLNDELTENATIFLRELDRQTFQIATKLLQKDSLQAVEMMLKSLRVGGDEASVIIDNFAALRSAGDALTPMLIAREGSLKKN